MRLFYVFLVRSNRKPRFDWFERLGSVEPNKVLRLFQSSERLYQFLPQCFGLLRLEQGAAGLCNVCPADGVDEPTQRFGQGDAYFGGCGFILQHLQVLLYVRVIRIVAQQANGRDALVRRQGRVGNALVVALYAGKLGGDTFQDGGLFFWCIQPVGGGIVVFYGFLYGTLWEEGQSRA